MFLIIDGIVILIIVLSVIANAKRGFVKSVAVVAAGVLSVAVSAAVSVVLAPVVYDSFAGEIIMDKVAENLGDTDLSAIISQTLIKEQFGVQLPEETVREALKDGGDIQGKLASMVSELTGRNVSADQMKDALEENLPEELESGILENNRENITKVIQALSQDDPQKRLDMLEEAAVRPVSVGVIRILLSLVLFSVFFMILKKLAELLDFVDRIPVAGLLNTVLGGVLGAVEGLVLVAVAAFIIRIVIMLGAGGSLLSEEVIGETTIFKFIYQMLNDLRLI